MDDIRPVYDLFCPSPVPLKDLASFELALNLWQREIFKLRDSKTLRKWESISNTRPASRMPNLPRSLASGIDKYIEGIIKSIYQWLRYHESRWYHNPYTYLTYMPSVDYAILNHFVDFVLDWNGSLHYERTAWRMMLGEGIDADLKFKMACMYFLEEDIVKLWPSVSSYMFLDRLDFNSQPELYYWVGRLRNQSYDKVLFYFRGEKIQTVEEAVLRCVSDGHLWSAMKYFSTNTIPKDASESTTFVRYLLPGCMADEVLLAKALPRVICWFHTANYINSRQILKVWTCIKDKITSQDCIQIIRTIFLLSYEGSYYLELDPFHLVELWNNTSDEFKKLAPEEILQNLGINLASKNLPLLMAILSCTSARVRSEWWHWWLHNVRYSNLIPGTNSDELRTIMELCIGDQIKINEFLQNVLPGNDYIRQHCLKLVSETRFTEFHNLVRLYFPDERSMKDFQKRLLIECIFALELPLLENASSFKQFIYSSYDDLEDANHYINRVLLSRTTIDYLKQCMLNEGQFQAIMQFVDTFASDAFATRLKHEDLVPALLSQFAELGIFCLKRYCDDFGQFLVWCLENENEIARFKQQINLDNLIQRLVWKENSLNKMGRTRGKLPSHCVINQLIEWYLGTDQAVAEFKRKYAHDELFAEWFGV